MKRVLVIIIGLFISFSVFSQGKVKGYVFYEEKHEHADEHEHKAHVVKVPLVNANVYWEGTSVGTTTDENGKFVLKRHGDLHEIVISYIGFKNDTVCTHMHPKPDIVLQPDNQLSEVTVKDRQKGTYVSHINSIKTEKITTEGLQKMACCNLSESFENNATVDVGFSDAVSGAKQIKMLGLAGIYTQFTLENVPVLRGLSSSYGLSYVPGTWMESIAVSKGNSAVVNGYESITGQINLEFKKPFRGEKVFVNLYANSKLKTEANFNAAYQISDRWSTALLAHYSSGQAKFDNNGDGFLDMPLTKQLNLMNRWSYEVQGKSQLQFGLNLLTEERLGGQKNFNFSDVNKNDGVYGFGMNTNAIQGFVKNGYTLGIPGGSLGLIASVNYQEIDAYYGNRNRDAKQLSFYANAILQGIIVSSEHKYSIGGSFSYDDYDEVLDAVNLQSEEKVPGVFAQYTYDMSGVFNVIVGNRLDYNSEYGLLYTPRIHSKWNINEKTTVRASAGLGYRTPSAISDNAGLLSSSKMFVFIEEPEVEKAFNYGFNFTRDINIAANHEITAGVDLYRTEFMNSYVADVNRDFKYVYFYNLKGKSYSNSFQTDLMYSYKRFFDVTLAYRFNDVKVEMDNEMQDKPMVSKHKGLLTVSYASKSDKFKIDVTNQLTGAAKLIDTENIPEQYQKPDKSETFYTLHAQITYKIKQFEIYAGGENLTGFVQENPILSSENPFSDYFDASMVWGPIMGQKFYLGIRYRLK